MVRKNNILIYIHIYKGIFLYYSWKQYTKIIRIKYDSLIIYLYINILIANIKEIKAF